MQVERETFPLGTPNKAALLFNRIRLTENGILPESDISLRKVAKIFHFLATFFVLPRPSLSYFEPMPHIVERLFKLV